MSRTVEEWIGQTDDTAIPARVKVRIFERCNGECVLCGVRILGGVRPTFDHAIALINGGQNRESNLQLLCMPCHSQKTKSDVAEKAIAYRKRLNAIGVRKPSRFPGSRNSKFKKKIDGTVVLR